MTRPCPTFVTPTGSYPAYCAACHFSRRAHDLWDEWPS